MYALFYRHAVDEPQRTDAPTRYNDKVKRRISYLADMFSLFAAESPGVSGAGATVSVQQYAPANRNEVSDLRGVLSFDMCVAPNSMTAHELTTA